MVTVSKDKPTRIYDCFLLFNCCSCGGGTDCGCPYCFDCNACDACKDGRAEDCENL